MGEHDPERKARRMRNTESLSDDNQFAAVHQRNRRRKGPDINNECSKKYCGSAEQLRPEPGNRPSIDVRLLASLRSDTRHGLSSRKLGCLQTMKAMRGRIAVQTTSCETCRNA